MINVTVVSVDFKVSYSEEQTLSFKDEMFRKGWSNSSSQKTGSNAFFRSGTDSMLSSLKFIKTFPAFLPNESIAVEAKNDVSQCASSNDILSYTMFASVSVEANVEAVSA